MKVVHVIEPLAGGMVTFLTSLVENLPEDMHLIIHGKREHIVPLSEVKKKFSSGNVKFIRWHSAHRNLNITNDIKAFLQLYLILKRLKKSNLIDVIHLHCSKGGFLGRMVCRLLGLQHMVIYTPNGAPFMAGATFIANFMYRKLEQFAAFLGGRIVCCSPSEQQAYQCAGIKAITINNGISYKKIIPPVKAAKKDMIFRVVTSGRIVEQKDPALFNKIAAYFEEFNNVEFIWVGDGEASNVLTSKNIRKTGWLTPEKANRLVASADVYLSTARYEGLPFAVLEALALKMPVLLKDCTGNKDLTNNLNGAVFFDENSAILRLLQFQNNESMLKVMGQHSASYGKTNFNLADTFRRYKALYQQAALIPKLSYPLK